MKPDVEVGKVVETPAVQGRTLIHRWRRTGVVAIVICTVVSMVVRAPGVMEMIRGKMDPGVGDALSVEMRDSMIRYGAWAGLGLVAFIIILVAVSMIRACGTWAEAAQHAVRPAEATFIAVVLSFTLPQLWAAFSPGGWYIDIAAAVIYALVVILVSWRLVWSSSKVLALVPVVVGLLIPAVFFGSTIWGE